MAEALLSKFRAFMKKTILSVCLGFVLSGVTGLALAEKADRNKPMNVEADALRYDDLKQVSVFSGNVVLTKGTIVIRGARLEVNQDPDGYQFGTVTGTAAQPAFFRQKRDGVDEYIEGNGETIEYDGRADTVRFIKKAKLRRLRGTSLADEVTGGNILYENLSDKFTVDGTPKTATTPAGRVRAMLTPKPDPTSETPAPAPATTLRVTPQIEKVEP